MKTLICNIIVVCAMAPGAWAEEGAPVVNGLEELTKAYQRELLFLSTYRQELIQKTKTMNQSLGGKLAEAKKELEQMEQHWLKLQTDNEMSLQKLSLLEKDHELKKENQESLETTLKQASGAETETALEAEASLTTRVEKAFLQGSKSLQELGQIRTQPGSFYLENGDLVKGEIVKIGDLAWFGVHDKGFAALYPAGEGSFRVWQWLKDDQAVALKSGNLPENLKFFLIENPDKEFVAQAEKTLYDVLQAGGLIGWVIVALGFFALAIAGIRFYLLKKAGQRDEAPLQEVLQFVAKSDIESAQHLLVTQDNAVGRVLTRTLSFLKSEPLKVEDAIQEAILKESQIIDRFGVVLLVVASVAPLLGLLGTVTGMIATFDIITLYGTGNPKMLSGGISEALVTTMFGLIVAIPALLIGQYLSSRTETIKSDMEKWALSLCNSFQNRRSKT